jgi:hypothetical protein
LRCHNTDFNLYCRAIVVKTAWYWHKNLHEDQWNRKEDLDKHRHRYSHLTKEPKTYIGEKMASSTNGAGKAGYIPVED